MANASSTLPTKTMLSAGPVNTPRKRKRDKTSCMDMNIDSTEEDDEDEEDNDDKAEVEKKIVELQKIVPGGESLENVDTLFEETAGYILDLQNQIKGLRVLASFFELLEHQKSKLGG